MESTAYWGRELDFFALAVTWKRYWCSQVSPWVKGDVLEVGAGLGANTKLLQNPAVRTWHCVEPDPDLARQLAETVKTIPNCSTQAGSLRSVSDRLFDSILYIDVLEHIKADREEMQMSATKLKPGGHLVVLSPAHSVLYSPFDAAIGHYRRYNKRSLSACSPAGCVQEAMFYLDCAGMATGLVNRLFLRQEHPSLTQILTWDRFMVPLSQRLLDPITGFRLGKTIIGVWRRTA